MQCAVCSVQCVQRGYGLCTVTSMSWRLIDCDWDRWAQKEGGLVSVWLLFGVWKGREGKGGEGRGGPLLNLPALLLSYPSHSLPLHYCVLSDYDRDCEL